MTDDLYLLLRHAVDQEDDVRNAASDLWTWLPSYDPEADTPPVADVIKEACGVISRMRDEMQFGGLDEDFAEDS